MGEAPENEARFRLGRKEWATLIFGTALALGSFKSDDAIVVVPMLFIAGLAFVLLCFWHQGNPLWRVLVAAALLLVLVFIGWRDLRHVPSIPPTPVATPVPTPPTIIQNATDSACSNFVAASDAQIKCLAEEKVRHAKDNTHR
jgi:hypothetical protein